MTPREVDNLARYLTSKLRYDQPQLNTPTWEDANEYQREGARQRAREILRGEVG